MSLRALSLATLLAGAALPAPAGQSPPFVDVAAERGLRFENHNGFGGRRYIVEITGMGGGFFDYDGDGDMDALLLDGAPLPGTPPPPEPWRNRLFRNDGGRFTDATEAARLGHEGYGMGVAVGDIDGDGDPDLLVTNYGPDVLYRNRGDGTFEDVTAEAGVGDDRWNTSAAFFDMDGDGDLDLYVAAYVDFDPQAHVPCLLRGIEAYCGPNSYGGLTDRLYRNDGTGRFTDVSADAGILEHVGKGLGVVAGDVDGDGDQDLYVANDSTANFLFINGTEGDRVAFTEEALFFGVAYGEGGRAEAGMGTDMGDYDGDGDLDVVCTNIEGETNALYRNDGPVASEVSYSAGMGASTLPRVGFGVRFLDYDLDGDLDLMVTNGHVIDNVSRIRQGSTFEQPSALYENTGDGFVEVCPGCLPVGVGRGLATGDFDDDGDVDVLINNNRGPAYLLENVGPKQGTAIGLRLEGTGRSNRDAYGARVSWKIGEAAYHRDVRAAASFCSTNDPRLLLAVPDGAGATPVEVVWPDGSRESFELRPGSYHHVVEGEGVVSSSPFRY